MSKNTEYRKTTSKPRDLSRTPSRRRPVTDSLSSAISSAQKPMTSGSLNSCVVQSGGKRFINGRKVRVVSSKRDFNCGSSSVASSAMGSVASFAASRAGTMLMLKTVMNHSTPQQSSGATYAQRVRTIELKLRKTLTELANENLSPDEKTGLEVEKANLKRQMAEILKSKPVKKARRRRKKSAGLKKSH